MPTHASWNLHASVHRHTHPHTVSLKDTNNNAGQRDGFETPVKSQHPCGSLGNKAPREKRVFTFSDSFHRNHVMPNTTRTPERDVSDHSSQSGRIKIMNFCSDHSWKFNHSGGLWQNSLKRKKWECVPFLKWPPPANEMIFFGGNSLPCWCNAAWKMSWWSLLPFTQSMVGQMKLLWLMSASKSFKHVGAASLLLVHTDVCS